MSYACRTHVIHSAGPCNIHIYDHPRFELIQHQRVYHHVSWGCGTKAARLGSGANGLLQLGCVPGQSSAGTDGNGSRKKLVKETERKWRHPFEEGRYVLWSVCESTSSCLILFTESYYRFLWFDGATWATILLPYFVRVFCMCSESSWPFRPPQQVSSCAAAFGRRPRPWAA